MTIQVERLKKDKRCGFARLLYKIFISDEIETPTEQIWVKGVFQINKFNSSDLKKRTYVTNKAS